MFCAMMKWRLEGDVEKIVALGEEGMKDAEGFIAQMSSGKTYIQGTDREGRPVVYIHVRLHRLMDQSAKALEGELVPESRWAGAEQGIRLCHLLDGVLPPHVDAPDPREGYHHLRHDVSPFVLYDDGSG